MAAAALASDTFQAVQRRRLHWLWPRRIPLGEHYPKPNFPPTISRTRPANSASPT